MRRFVMTALAILLIAGANAQATDKLVRKNFIHLLKQAEQARLAQYKGEQKSQQNFYHLSFSANAPLRLLSDSATLFYNKSDSSWSISFYFTNKSDNSVRAAKITKGVLENKIKKNGWTIYEDYDDGKFYDEYSDANDKDRCSWFVGDYGRGSITVLRIYDVK